MEEEKKKKKRQTVGLEDITDPKTLESLLAEALRNARKDRNLVKKLLHQLVNSANPTDEASMNFRAGAVAKVLDSLAKTNSQLIDIARMIITNKSADNPAVLGVPLPITELGINPEDLFDRFGEEKEALDEATDLDDNKEDVKEKVDN